MRIYAKLFFLLAPLSILLAACFDGFDNAQSEENLAGAKAALAAAKQSEGPGDPALWKYENEQTTVYIFGSVHVLHRAMNWKTDLFEESFNSAEKLVFEIDLSNENIGIQSNAYLMSESAFRSGEELSDYLTRSEKKKLDNISKQYGMSLYGLDGFRPWYVTSLLATASEGVTPYSKTYGVESTLLDDAEELDVEYGFLETPEDVAAALTSGSVDEQIDNLILALDVLELTTKSLTTLIQEWREGDMEGIRMILENEALMATGQGYDNLLRIRNKNWVEPMEVILNAPGTTFVTVGVAHLTSEDNLIELLENKGYRFERVQ